MYYVYILLSRKDKRTYVGYTKDILERLNRHNEGSVNATKYRRPFEVLLLEEYQYSKEAKARETWWKSSSGRKKMKSLFS